MTPVRAATNPTLEPKITRPTQKEVNEQACKVLREGMNKELLTHIKGHSPCNQTISSKPTRAMLSQQSKDDRVVKWTIPKEEQVEKLFLGEVGSNKHVYIKANLQLGEKDKLHNFLKEYKDVFSWKYTNLERVPEHINIHNIILEPKNMHVQSQFY